MNRRTFVKAAGGLLLAKSLGLASAVREGRGVYTINAYDRYDSLSGSVRGFSLLRAESGTDSWIIFKDAKAPEVQFSRRDGDLRFSGGEQFGLGLKQVGGMKLNPESGCDLYPVKIEDNSDHIYLDIVSPTATEKIRIPMRMADQTAHIGLDRGIKNEDLLYYPDLKNAPGRYDPIGFEASASEVDTPIGRLSYTKSAQYDSSVSREMVSSQLTLKSPAPESFVCETPTGGKKKKSSGLALPAAMTAAAAAIYLLKKRTGRKLA